MNRCAGEGAGGASGQVSSIGAFNVSTPSQIGNWARGGICFETNLGKASVLIVMLNGTTQGSAPTAWVWVSGG